MMAVFLGLGLYYFLVDLPAEKKKKQEKEIAEKILPLEAANVTEFSLIKKDQTISLQRNPKETWSLSQPLNTSGDYSEAESFLSDLEGLKKSRVVENNPKDLSTYGLDSPSIKIHLRFKTDKEETLLLGNESPMGGKIYLKLESDKAVFLAATSKANFDKPVFHFRDKTIFNFSSGSITQIKIERTENPFSLTREKEEWKVSSQIAAKADKDSVMSFLQALQFARVKEFEDDNPESLEIFGLDKPATALILENEDKKTFSLELGLPKSSSTYYAKLSGKPGVFLVDKNFYDTLAKKNVDFLLKTLIEFEEKEVAELTIQNKNEKIKITRIDKDQWEIKEPQKTAADPATLRSLLFDLKEAELTEFIKLSLDAQDAFGLNKPKRSFSVKMNNGESTDIQFGNTTLDGKQFFAQRTGESTVFSVSEETAKKLFRSFHELRNKKLFHFETEGINKILIETQQTQFALQKSGASWSMLKPEKMKIKEFLGNDLVWAMKGLEFQTLVEPSLPLDSLGLAPPSYKISLWKSESEKIAELHVGNLDDKSQEHYVLAADKSVPYRVKKKYLGAIPLELQKFKIQQN